MSRLLEYHTLTTLLARILVLRQSASVTAAKWFTCNNQNRVAAHKRCDCSDDCGDWSDEARCPFKNNRVIITCGGRGSHGPRRCIPRAWLCNGFDDCGNAWDERFCKNGRHPGYRRQQRVQGSKPSKMPSTHAKGVPSWSTLEGRKDKDSPKTVEKMADTSIDLVIIPSKSVDDMKSEIAKSLEMIMRKMSHHGAKKSRIPAIETVQLIHDKPRCNPDTEFYCKTPGAEFTCINKTYVCDGEEDCGNGDDENRDMCNYGSFCRDVKNYCPEKRWNVPTLDKKCPRPSRHRCTGDLTCVKTQNVCDGETNCEVNGEDEQAPLCTRDKCISKRNNVWCKAPRIQNNTTSTGRLRLPVSARLQKPPLLPGPIFVHS